MTFEVDDPPPSPGAVSAYLRSMGWVAVDAKVKSWMRFRSEVEGQEVVIEVPILADALDYPRRFAQLVDDLSRIERRSVSTLTRDIRTSASDVIRVRMRGAPGVGRISVENGWKAFRATRDLLLAAACSTVQPRAVFAKRKFTQAHDYLERARFGPTESGSFVLTVESVVPPQLGLFPSFDVEPEPFDRMVAMTLARATQAARRIVDEVSVTGSIDPVIEGVKHGVSSNLCDALAGLLDAGLSQSVDMAFQWAPSRPAPQAPRSVSFDGGAIPVLTEMARTLREHSEIEDFELVGPVHWLESTALNIGGEISVAMTDPFPGRKVRVLLEPATYKLAVAAHGAGLFISCIGTLVQSGGRLELRNPRGFRPLAEKQARPEVSSD